MSNGVGSPKDDIKKYDNSFLKSQETPSVRVDLSKEQGIDSTSIFGVGYTEEEKLAEQQYLEQEASKQSIDYDMNLVEKGARSFVAGLGDLVVGLGDATDFITKTSPAHIVASELSKEIYGLDTTKPVSSFFSDAFHKAGKELQSVGDPVAELSDVSNVTFNDMFDIDFWFTHASRAVPFTLSFFIPGMAGARGAQAVYRGLSAANKSFSVGRKMQQLGLVKHMHQGSKFAKGATSFAGGAALGNISEGTIIAGQVYNDALRDGLTKEQASVVAHDTFVDNMKWMAVDGLQLGFVTGGNKFLKAMLPKNTQKALSLNFTKAPGIKSVIGNMAKVSGIVLTDGMLEQFQEVYQDWSSKSNLAEAKGEEFMSYMDYFTSQEALPTRVIAFASSMAVSGVKAAVDVSAERKRLFTLEKGFDEEFLFQDVEQFDLTEKQLGEEPGGGTRATSGKSVQELKALKVRQLDKLLVKRVLEGKGDYYVDLVNHLLEEGKITEEQHASFTETAKEMETLVESTPSIGLNEKEKARVILATRQKNRNKNIVDRQLQSLESEKEKIKAQGLEKDQEAAMLAGVEEAIAEVKAGDIQLLDEAGNPQLDEAGNPKTARTENQVHESAIKNVYAQATMRREQERVERDVLPQLNEIVDKEARGEELTEEEQAFIADTKNKPYYDEIVATGKVKKAQQIAGADFSIDFEAQKNAEEGTFVFTKTEGETVTTKTVDAAGNVTETVTTQESVNEETTDSAKEKTEKSEDNRTQEKEVDKDVTSKEDVSDTASVTGGADKVKNIQAKSETLSAARQRLGKRLYGGQLEVWADEQMELEPNTAIFFDESLIDDLGKPAIGMAIGLAKFINPLTMTQEVFHHENWHTYQTLYQNTPEMQALLTEIVNQPVFERVKLDNYNELDVEYKGRKLKFRDLIRSKVGVVTIEQWKADNSIETEITSDSAKRRYLADMELLMASQGFNILPDAQQGEIKNEALAVAAGLQDTLSSPFWNNNAKKENSKVRTLLTNAWARIKKGSTEETADILLANHFPEYFNQDYNQMLSDFRNAVNKQQNPISWNTYTKSKGMFLKDSAKANSHQIMSADASINLAIAQSQIIEDEANAIAEAYTEEQDLSSVLSKAASRIEARRQELLFEVKETAKTNNVENSDTINSRFTKNLKRIESNILTSLIQTTKSKLADVESTELDTQNQDELTVKFGDFLNEEFKRGTSRKVTSYMNDFLELYNKNKKKSDSHISKSKLETVLGLYLDGNRYNYNNFEEQVSIAIKNVNKDTSASSNERIIKEFIEFVNTKLNKPGDNLEVAMSNVWSYFKSFRHENVFQFNIDSDGNIVVSESIPRGPSIKISKATEVIRESLISDKETLFGIMNILEASKDPKRKKAALLSLFNNTFNVSALEIDQNDKFLEEDLENIKVAGMPVMDYFSEERINLLQSQFLSVDWDSVMLTFKDKFESKNTGIVNLEDPAVSGRVLTMLINRMLQGFKVGVHYNLAQQAQQKLKEGKSLTKDEQSSYDKYGAAVALLRNNYKEYQANKADEKEYNTNFYVAYSFDQDNKMPRFYPNSNKLNAKRTNTVQDSFIKQILQASFLSRNTKTLLGQVRNPENEMLGTFNKTSNLYNNIDNLESSFKSMRLDRQGAYPTRLRQLFPNNPYAYMMFEAVYNQNALQNNKMQGRVGQWSPEIGYMSGYYDGRSKKGFKNSRMNPVVAKQTRFMHIVDSIKNKAKQYRHFIGVFGDSQRQYFMNNAILFDSKNLENSYQNIANTTNDKVNIEERIDSLFNELLEAGLVKKSDKKVVAQAYKQNYVNKFLVQDLYFNKSIAINDNKMLIDTPKRMKGITSPMSPITDSRILPIIVKDDKLKTLLQELNIADSESFVLPEHQKLIELSYGELNETGNNLKPLYYGQNLDNTAFEKHIGRVRVPLYFKTATKVLDEQFSASSEILRSIREVLKETMRRHEGENVIPIVYFDSSIKGGITSDELSSITHSVEDIINAAEDIYFLNKQKGSNANTSYESLIQEGKVSNLQKFIKNQNSWYQFEDETGNVVTGFDGKNFGLQTKLDNQNNTGTLAKQVIANFNVFNVIEQVSSGPNKGKTGYELLEPIKQALADILQLQYDNNFKGTDLEQVFNDNKESLESFIDSHVIDILGINFIGNQQPFNSVVSSQFKKKVMKLDTAGTFSVEMSDIGQNLKIEGKQVTYSETLKSYKVSNGKVTKAEIILPYIAKLRGAKVGDQVLASRIPASKPGDGIVYVVKSFNASSAGNAVIIPSEHATLMGSDKDGDGLHINMKDKSKNLSEVSKKKNEFLDLIFDLFTAPEVYKVIMQPVDFQQSITNKGLNHISNIIKDPKAKQEFSRTQNDLHIDDEYRIQDRFLGNFIGIAASLNRVVNYFASSGLANDSKTDVRVLSGGKSMPILSNIIDSKGTVHTYNTLVNQDKQQEHWLTYAQFLNFIIDDGKNGDRAKFNITKESANHFSYLLRTGMPIQSVLDLMYNQTYVSYTQNRAAGLGKREAIAKIYGKKVKELPKVSMSEKQTVNLTKQVVSPKEFMQLIGILDSVTGDMQTIADVLNLDTKVPNSIIDLVVLEKEFNKVMDKQNTLRTKFNNDPYLLKHKQLLQDYKAKLEETSTISVVEAETIVDLMGATIDLKNPNSAKLVNEAVNFYKLSTQLKSNFEGKSFHNLYLDALGQQYSGESINSFTELEKAMQDYTGEETAFSESEYAIIKLHSIMADKIKTYRNEGNKFLNILQSNLVKVSRAYKPEGQKYARTVSRFINRFTVPLETKNSILSIEDLNEYKASFMELPVEIRNFFIGYEYLVNKFGANGNSLMAFLPKEVVSEVKRASDKVYTNTFVETAPGVKTRNNSVIEELINLANNTGQTFNEDGSRFNKALVSSSFEGGDKANLVANLTELLINYDPVAFASIVNDAPLYMAQAHQVMMGDIKAFTGQYSKEQANLSDKFKGKQAFSTSIYDYVSNYTFEVFEKQYILADRDMTELNVINMFGASLDNEVNVVKSTTDGRMFLRDTYNEGMFGTEESLSKEGYARRTGYIRGGYTLESLQTAEPAIFEKLETEYAEYVTALNKVDGDNGIRDRFLSDKRMRMPEMPYNEIPNDYYIEANKAISEYQTELYGLPEIAKTNITKIIHFKYGEIISQTQNQRWRNVVAPDGEKVGEYLLEQINQEDYDKDISYAAMMLSPGDFGQHQPTLAGVRRNIEIANSQMHRDLKKVQEELNNAYIALYKEKYGLLTGASRVLSQIPGFNLLHPLSKVAENLFKNIQVQKTRLVHDENDGKQKAEHITELNRKYFTKKNKLTAAAKKELTPAEYNYAKVVSKYTTFYSDLLESYGIDNKRSYYRPLSTASRFETFRRRGLYGLYFKSLSKDNNYHNIAIKAYDPFSTRADKMEVKTYGEFKALYSVTRAEAKAYADSNLIYTKERDSSGRPVRKSTPVDLDFFTQAKRIKALRTAKKIAQGHMLKMKDELGNPIRIQDGVSNAVRVENETINRFTSQRSAGAAYSASANLHHAMYEYLKTMVFQYGTAYKGEQQRMHRMSFELGEDKLYGKKTNVAKRKSLSIDEFNSLENRGEAKNFMGFENQKFMVDAAMSYLKHGRKDNSARYLKEVVMDRFIRQLPKKTLSGSEKESQIISSLVRWTMLVGLGFNIPASVFNVVIGKYNAYRSQGFVGFAKSHARIFGVDKLGQWDRRAATKAQKMLEEFGVLTYRPQDQLEDSAGTTLIDQIIFSPMTTAEKFIQRAQFMGELSDAQWDAYSLDKDGNLIVVDPENVLTAGTIAKYSRRVQNVQGRGYSEVDQRMIQTYAFGSMLLQFKRWLPTYLVDRFGKLGYGSYMDDFGNVYRGTSPAVLKNLQLYANPIKYKENKSKLDKASREAIERYHRGMLVPMFIGLLLLASSEDDKEKLKSVYIDLERLIGDMLLVGNVPQYTHTLTIPAMATAENILGLAFSIASQDTYKRDAVYGERGDKKSKRYLASLFPKLEIPGTGKNLRQEIFGVKKTRGEKARARNKRRRKRESNRRR